MTRRYQSSTKIPELRVLKDLFQRGIGQMLNINEFKSINKLIEYICRKKYKDKIIFGY